MSRYRPGYRGPTTTAGPNTPRNSNRPFGGRFNRNTRPGRQDDDDGDDNKRPRRLRRTGSAFEGRPAPRPRPTRGNTGPSMTRGGSGRNPILAGNTNVRRGRTMMKKGGKVSSCSKRADGCAKRGKTKGRMV